MNRYYYLLLILLTLSCNNERILQLPKIENAEITEVLDVSPAYIFYDETQPDSTLLNRKNLISTTNWLVNVDKRLTLRQAIPHITFLQDKKRNAEIHKNENAKNYFTCNDTSIGNLGFVEFTDVNYLGKDGFVEDNSDEIWKLTVFSLSNIRIISASNIIHEANVSNLEDVITRTFEKDNSFKKLFLCFNKNLSFQEYITIKMKLQLFEKNILKDELIFHP